MWRTIPTKPTFPCKFIQNEKTQPETNQRTNPPNCNHHHHRNVCPRCQEDQADRWSGKNAAPTFLERSQLGHSWWFFWENPGQKGVFWNIGIPTLVTFSMILFAQNFDSQLSRGRSSPSCCEWKRAMKGATPQVSFGGSNKQQMLLVVLEGFFCKSSTWSLAWCHIMTTGQRKGVYLGKNLISTLCF